MNKKDYLKIIEEAKKVDRNYIKQNDGRINSVISAIYEFIFDIEEKYIHLVDNMIASNVRFCDYYDCDELHGDAIIDYFNENYFASDKEDVVVLFALYVFLRNSVDLVCNFDLCDSIEELYELLDNESYFEDLLYMMEYIKERELLNAESAPELEFMNPSNKYKIFFTGNSYKDIKNLPKNLKKAFIRKISGFLSKSDIIPLVESIDHVKDLYDIPIFRIRFSNDYRIAYIRKNNVTIILGVTLKTGKNLDYTQYDFIADKISVIYREVDSFLKGTLEPDADHYKVIEHLENFNKKLNQ